MRYRVRGMRSNGTFAALELHARDEDDANQQAAVQGVAVLSVQRLAAWPFRMRRRGSRFPLLLFSQELLALLQSGVSLMESLQTLAEKEQRTEVRKTVCDLVERLCEGLALSAAMRRHPAAFPGLYVATVSASERTGDLATALTRYIAYHTQVDALRRKLVAASIYPLMLLAVGALVLLFLVGYVVPRFSHIYEGMGGALPLPSRVLLHIGQLVEHHGLLLLAVVLAAGAGCAQWLMRRETARCLARLLWRVPAIGQRVRLYELARFYRTLGMLLCGGLSIMPALGMVRGLLESGLRERLEEAERVISEGRAISEAMESNGLTTSVATRMLRVGERSGRMGEMMERIAAFYEDETARSVEWFTRLFEPLLMAVIGVLIGAIVLLLYLPIFELAGNLQ